MPGRNEFARLLPLLISGIGAAGIAILGPVAIGAVLVSVMSLVALIRYSWLRVGWFVFGALLVFQTSDTVNGAKLAYLGGAGLVAVISGMRVLRSRAHWLTPFHHLLTMSLVLMLLLLVSLVTALRGSPFSSWLRDASPVLLLMLSPFVALDCAHDLGEKAIFRITLLAGFGGAVGFTSDWLDRRGVSSLPFGRLLLATTALAAAGMAVAVTRAALGRRHLVWAVIAASVPAMMLTTGTRTILSFSAALGGIVGARPKARVGALFMVTRIAIPVLAIPAILVPVLGPLVASEAFFDARVRAALTVLRSDPAADQSYAGRQRAYVAVLEEIPKHPFLGVGPGNLQLDISLDTPLTTVLKFGIVGIAVIVLWFGTLTQSSKNAAVRYGYGAAHTQLRAFLCIILAMIPFGSPLEDKGLPMAICLLTASIGVSARCAAERARSGLVASPIPVVREAVWAH